MEIVQIQQELHEVLNYILDREEIPREELLLKFKDVRRGRMNPSGLLTIPLWALKEGIHYAYYYLIHEISHYISYRRKTKDRCSGHGPEFKTIEKFWLVEFGLYPKYGKAYAKKLLSESGKVLWQKYW